MPAEVVAHNPHRDSVCRVSNLSDGTMVTCSQVINIVLIGECTPIALNETRCFFFTECNGDSYYRKKFVPKGYVGMEEYDLHQPHLRHCRFCLLA